MATSPSVFRLAESGQKLVRGNGQFAWNIFKKLTESGKITSKDNVFYSPMSISLALAMTYAGARNTTRQQMREVQGYSELDDDTHVHSCFEDLHTQLHSSDGSYTLRTANRLYVEKSFDVLQDFLETMKQHYKTELSLVDFKAAFEEARKDINSWVEEQTAQKIQNLLAEGVLDALTRLVLVNAIYFKGNWLEQFDPKNTYDGDFYVTEEEKIPVKMMYQQKEFRYGWHREMDVKTLELPYVGEQLSMLLIQPASSNSLEQVIQKLTPDHLLDFDKTFGMQKIKTQVHLPKFKLEGSFDLGDTLAAMGMPDLFDERKADLTGIDAANQLFVSKVIHKAFIEVNEEGSEAAAATAVKIGLRSMPRIMEFRANKPFLFFIRENASNSILFFGRVAKPPAAEGKDEL